MHRRGFITFGDIAGKLTMLRLTCDRCGRAGQYRVDRLIRERGRDASLMEWKAERTADCPHGKSGDIDDQCRAVMPDIAKVVLE
jgi:hypothetical protein